MSLNKLIILDESLQLNASFSDYKCLRDWIQQDEQKATANLLYLDLCYYWNENGYRIHEHFLCHLYTWQI